MYIIKTKSFGLRVHPAGLILLALMALVGHGAQMLLAIAALLLHEGFHTAAILILGVKLERIELTPFGAVADVESFQSLAASWQVLIALSGALGSLLCYFVLRKANLPGDWITQFMEMNLMLGAFNLLPILPLDGARALGAVADRFSCGRWVRKGMMGLAFLVAGCMLCAALYGAWHGHINATLLFVAPYLCYAARQAYVSQRMRLTEERLRMSAKLSHGHAWKVQGIACGSNVSRHELLKMLLAQPGGRFHYFFLINPKSGKVERVLEEGKVIEEIMGEEAGMDKI